MLPRTLIRRLLPRVLLAPLLYALLMLVWLPIGEEYGRAFRALANTVFEHLIDETTTRFVATDTVAQGLAPGARMHDTSLGLFNNRDRQYATIPISSQYIAYVPAALFVALALPTPVPWRRRWLGLLGGFLLIQCFVLLRCAAMIFSGYCRPEVGMFAPPSWVRRSLAFGSEMLTVSLTMSFIVPIALWVLVMFRRGDLTTLLAPAGVGTEAKPKDAPARRRRSQKSRSRGARTGSQARR